jgi:hypothetical protein
VNAINQSGKETERQTSAAAAHSSSALGTASNSAYSFNTSSDPQVSKLANGPFGGITIIELRPDPNWERSNRYLVLFISPEGNYASLAPLGFKAGCISWVIEHSSDFSSLTFGGSKASNSNPNIFNRSICPQFTVKSHGNETVRLVRGSSAMTANIIARIPLQTPDWSMQVFDRYAIRGVRLGPADIANPNPSRNVFELSSLMNRVLFQFAATAPPDPLDRKSGHAKPVYGFYAARDVTGWPSDVRVLTWHTGTPAESKNQSEWDQLLLEMHGTPSLKVGPINYWAYDLRGNRLSEKDAGPENCLGSTDLLLRLETADPKPFRDILGRDDLGPWGCVLVVRMAGVNSYQVDTVAGFALAQSVFKGRLAEVRRYKEASTFQPQ